ncbi:MAG: putative toxin-antitoxin system toxin component, PIN family [Planctomycetes bacterium]|nr:putative toxin-antitoxin system toxin component, PIN family [Planctomycetota bacterium]
MRVVLDANVLIAAFATRGLCHDVLETALARHEAVTSEPILEEVCGKLRGKIRVPAPIVGEIRSFLLENLEQVEPLPVEPSACRDPGDLAVLGTAAAAHADAIVTGDKDLLVLGSFGTCRIVTPRQFWEAARRG